MNGLMLLGAVTGEIFLTWTKVEVVCTVALLVQALLLVWLRPSTRGARRREVRGAVSLGLLSLLLALAGTAMYGHFTLDPRQAHFALVYQVLNGLFTLMGWGIVVLTALSLGVGAISLLVPSSLLDHPQASVTVETAEAAETPGAAEEAALRPDARPALPAGWAAARRQLSPWLEVLGVLYAASVATTLLVLLRRAQDASRSGSALFRTLDLGLPLGLTVLFGMLVVLMVWDVADRSRRQAVGFVLIAILIVLLDLADDVRWLLVH